MIRSSVPAGIAARPRLRFASSFSHSPRLLAVALSSLGSLAPLYAGATSPEAELATVQVTESSTPAPLGLLPLHQSAGTGSRLGLSILETPASVQVIDRATIEATGAQDPRRCCAPCRA